MRERVLGVALAAAVLFGCAPGVFGPGVQAPPVDPANPEPRTVVLTQRAPEGIPLGDIFMTLGAYSGDVPVDIGFAPEGVKDGAYRPREPYAYLDARELVGTEFGRCFEIKDQPLVTCDLGDLEAGFAAAGVYVTLSPGVTLSCSSSAFVGGVTLGYRPLPCRLQGE